MVNFKKTRIPFFRRFVLQNFPFIEQDFDALTDYELICKVVEYLNKVIESTNASSEQIEILTDAFNNLQFYVEHYFDNLDIQEEINNKLEEMAEDGSLAELIQTYAFKDLNVSNNYEVITRKIHDTTRTLYYHKTILRAKDADFIPLKGCFSQDTISDSVSNPVNMFEFSTKVNSIFISNIDSAGTFNDHTAIIRNGEILIEGGTTHTNVLSIDNNGVINVNPGTSTATSLLTANAVNTWGCRSLIIDGTTNFDSESEPDLVNNKHPRTVILQEYDSTDIIFLHIEGRRPDSLGTTYQETADLIHEILPNVRCAAMLGGGGDSQLMINGRMLNDSNESQLRPLCDIIYLDPNITDYTNTGSIEIANARMSEETMHDLLKSRINLTETYLRAKLIVNAQFSNYASPKYNRFIGNVDYNTVLKTNDTIIVTFPDLSTVDGVNFGGICCFNIHYAGDVNQPVMRDEYGLTVKPAQISNKTLLLRWDGNNYRIISIIPTIAAPTSDELTDLNTITYYSMMSSNNFTNGPSFLGETHGGLVITIPLPLSGSYAYQWYIEHPNRRTFVRYLDGGTWTPWSKLESNDSVIKAGYDLDNLKGEYYHIYGNNLVNRPTNRNGWCLNIPGATGYDAQIFIERLTTSSDGNVFIRFNENSTWSEWRKFAFVS